MNSYFSALPLKCVRRPFILSRNEGWGIKRFYVADEPHRSFLCMQEGVRRGGGESEITPRKADVLRKSIRSADRYKEDRSCRT
ncbi:hypothetical protein [Treponema paraluiscuniculi]|uniref:hypothetical protein n=1 Tax=Treponema paraluiscuniculi TaxID=53435 RepID=UPI000A06EABB|nr:hypothetical protein [Treponema paraluiscuniculi]